MENEFITISEAAELTGKSDVDIMRLLKDRLQDSGLPIETIMKKEQREKGIMLLVSKGFLFQELSGSPKETKTETSFVQAGIGNKENELLGAKNEMIATLQKVIETKDRQMGDLSKKIDELIERDRETNILLKGLQDRIFLLEDSKNAKTEEKNPPSQKAK